MAKEKQQAEPTVELPPDPTPTEPQLSPTTLAEMEAGRKQAAINAQAMERAELARAEEAASLKK